LTNLPLADALKVSSFAEKAIQNPQAPAAIIGKYWKGLPNSYERLGADFGFTHLNLPEPSWTEFKLDYGEASWWPYINEPFAWRVAMSQKPVYVNVNPDDVSGGNLYAEIQALRQLGYTVTGKEIINGIELWKMVPSP